jgi:hypothetical protein
LHTRGGVLLLGAFEWDRDVWDWIQDERESKVFDASAAQCYNVNPRTLGAFANIYHKDTFPSILDWIGEQLVHGREPYDHVYKMLTGKGSLHSMTLAE